MIQVPRCLSLIACDCAHEDMRCGQYTLIGAMPKIRARKFPYRHPRLDVYFELTDGRGMCVVELAIVAPDLVSVVVKEERAVRFEDEPGSLAVGCFHFEGLLFEQKGHYNVRLSIDGDELWSRRLGAAHDPQGSESEEEENSNEEEEEEEADGPSGHGYD